MVDYTELENNLGHHFRDERLLINALTHPSFMKERSNQRLEFLGDAVLQLAISDVLYKTHTSVQEGALTNLRQHLVCQDALAQVARKIGLGTFLRMDKGCEIGGGRENDSVLSDAMEAVLAAVYLDAGYIPAKKIIESLWPLSDAEEFSDSKSALQEYLQKRGQSQPHYEILDESGPDHNKRFTVAVFVNDLPLGKGIGTSKKRAEQAAAREALKELKKADNSGGME